MPEQTLVSSFGRLLGQFAFDWFQSMYPKIKFRESSSFTIFHSNNNKSDMQMYDDDHPLADDVSCRTNYAKDHHSTTI